MLRIALMAAAPQQSQGTANIRIQMISYVLEPVPLIIFYGKDNIIRPQIFL
jgi:hypothetical protein